MAAFSPSFTITINSDGNLLTITDTSPWGTASDENYNKNDFARTFVLRDAYGATLTTVTLPDNVDASTYTISKNLWIETTFTVTGVVTLSSLQKEMFDRLMAIAYRNAINESNCCSSDTNLSSANMANLFLQGVNYAVPVGNGVDAQKFVDVAYSYVS